MSRKLFISYVVFLFLLTLFSYLFVDANLLYLHFLFTGFALQNRIAVTVIFIIFVSIFFLFYLQFIRLAKSNILSTLDIKKLIFLTIGVLIFSYPAMVSSDIFNYAATAKVLYFYHENPYIIMPIAFTYDPLLLFTHAANKIALYGPVWIFISAFPFLLSFGNFLASLFLFKIFSAVSLVLSLFIYNKLSKNVVNLTLFALNPLVIIETLVSGHNDMLMVAFMLVSIFFLREKRMLLSIVFLILSVGIKYASLFLVPAIIMQMFGKSDMKRTYLVSALGMLLIFLLSPIREEMYPWYAIWFLPFVFLSEAPSLIMYATVGLCFGLLLRYVPFMWLGTYFGPTPFFKIILTVVPVIGGICFYFLYTKIWSKKPFHFS